MKNAKLNTNDILKIHEEEEKKEDLSEIYINLDYDISSSDDEFSNVMENEEMNQDDQVIFFSHESSQEEEEKEEENVEKSGDDEDDERKGKRKAGRPPKNPITEEEKSREELKNCIWKFLYSTFEACARISNNTISNHKHCYSIYTNAWTEEIVKARLYIHDFRAIDRRLRKDKTYDPTRGKLKTLYSQYHSDPDKEGFCMRERKKVKKLNCRCRSIECYNLGKKFRDFFVLLILGDGMMTKGEFELNFAYEIEFMTQNENFVAIPSALLRFIFNLRRANRAKGKNDAAFTFAINQLLAMGVVNITPSLYYERLIQSAINEPDKKTEKKQSFRNMFQQIFQLFRREILESRMNEVVWIFDDHPRTEQARIRAEEINDFIEHAYQKESNEELNKRAAKRSVAQLKSNLVDEGLIEQATEKSHEETLEKLEGPNEKQIETTKSSESEGEEPSIKKKKTNEEIISKVKMTANQVAQSISNIKKKATEAIKKSNLDKELVVDVNARVVKNSVTEKDAVEYDVTMKIDAISNYAFALNVKKIDDLHSIYRNRTPVFDEIILYNRFRSSKMYNCSVSCLCARNSITNALAWPYLLMPNFRTFVDNNLGILSSFFRLINLKNCPTRSIMDDVKKMKLNALEFTKYVDVNLEEGIRYRFQIDDHDNVISNYELSYDVTLMFNEQSNCLSFNYKTYFNVWNCPKCENEFSTSGTNVNIIIDEDEKVDCLKNARDLENLILNEVTKSSCSYIADYDDINPEENQPRKCYGKPSIDKMKLFFNDLVVVSVNLGERNLEIGDVVKTLTLNSFKSMRKENYHLLAIVAIADPNAAYKDYTEMNHYITFLPTAQYGMVRLDDLAPLNADRILNASLRIRPATLFYYNGNEPIVEMPEMIKNFLTNGNFGEAIKVQKDVLKEARKTNDKPDKVTYKIYTKSDSNYLKIKTKTSQKIVKSADLTNVIDVNQPCSSAETLRRDLELKTRQNAEQAMEVDEQIQQLPNEALPHQVFQLPPTEMELTAHLIHKEEEAIYNQEFQQKKEQIKVVKNQIQQIEENIAKRKTVIKLFPRIKNNGLKDKVETAYRKKKFKKAKEAFLIEKKELKEQLEKFKEEKKKLLKEMKSLKNLNHAERIKFFEKGLKNFNENSEPIIDEIPNQLDEPRQLMYSNSEPYLELVKDDLSISKTNSDTKIIEPPIIKQERIAVNEYENNLTEKTIRIPHQKSLKERENDDEEYEKKLIENIASIQEMIESIIWKQKFWKKLFSKKTINDDIIDKYDDEVDEPDDEDLDDENVYEKDMSEKTDPSAISPEGYVFPDFKKLIELLEAYQKKKMIELGNLPALAKSNKTKCYIPTCIYESFDKKTRSLCAFHYAIIDLMRRKTWGLKCRVIGCKSKGDPITKGICKQCSTIPPHERRPIAPIIPEIGTLTDEQIRRMVAVDFQVRVVPWLREILVHRYPVKLTFDSLRVYDGLTKRPLLDRLNRHADSDSYTSGYFIAIRLNVFSNFENLRLYERYMTIYLAEIFGNENILNRVAGGLLPSTYADDFVSGESYLLIYTDKRPQTNYVDYENTSMNPFDHYEGVGRELEQKKEEEIWNPYKHQLPLFNSKVAYDKHEERRRWAKMLGYDVYLRSEDQSLPFICNYPKCTKRYSTLKLLLRHKLETLHYRCEYGNCRDKVPEIVFKSKEQLDQHHIKEHNFDTCPCCKGKFKDASYMVRHLKQSSTSSCICNLCKKRVVCKDYIDHMKKIHGGYDGFNT
ncbi:hypothetical protein PVAND_006273 [Polypedilum vanderplanki]|uniref:C2H2-type domain-containing protein n=1 Tax=Polypedilum vanderplanki TaxID=319348 RepID=A0A9J6C3P4_POLVA|nr:hypothetical protein PVAND_006273 [Polypedilum vanderplanki]